MDRKAATAREPAGGDGAAAAGLAADAAVPVLAALDPAARVGPASRAAALRPLLAGGNRALARAVLARKVEQSETGLLYTYDSSNFDGRYDAEIQRDRITLICKVRFVVDKDSFAAMGYSEAQMEQERSEFAASFPGVVSKAWSYKRALKPDWRGTMQCAVRAKVVDSGEHARITLIFPKAGFRSNIDARTTGQTTPTTGTFETDDLKSEKATWGLHTKHEFDFQHIVAAHEFGHMLGIEHIDKAGHKGDDEYGDTWEEANDIMGWGMTVTAHDMKPWIAAGKAYGKEVGMPGGGTWTVVDA